MPNHEEGWNPERDRDPLDRVLDTMRELMKPPESTPAVEAASRMIYSSLAVDAARARHEAIVPTVAIMAAVLYATNGKALGSGAYSEGHEHIAVEECAAAAWALLDEVRAARPFKGHEFNRERAGFYAGATWADARGRAPEIPPDEIAAASLERFPEAIA